MGKIFNTNTWKICIALSKNTYREILDKKIYYLLIIILSVFEYLNYSYLTGAHDKTT